MYGALTPHVQQSFRTTSKSENHKQNSDGMQKIFKNACTIDEFKVATYLTNTTCTIFAFENRSYLGQFEAEFKKALARESGAQGVLFDEKIS
jgi:hypothetical protein